MKIEEFNHSILPMRNDLTNYALRLTGNDNNAEDLVQEGRFRSTRYDAISIYTYIIR